MSLVRPRAARPQPQPQPRLTRPRAARPQPRLTRPRAAQPQPRLTDHGPHSHGFGSHSHTHGPGFSRGGLVGLGVAGGLVPSPSALLVLLAAIALGRTAFGIALVLSYGIGMAGALTAAGLILVKLRNQFARMTTGRSLRAVTRVSFLMPILTAGLVLLVGVGLTLRAAHGIV